MRCLYSENEGVVLTHRKLGFVLLAEGVGGLKAEHKVLLASGSGKFHSHLTLRFAAKFSILRCQLRIFKLKTTFLFSFIFDCWKINSCVWNQTLNHYLTLFGFTVKTSTFMHLRSKMKLIIKTSVAPETQIELHNNPNFWQLCTE